MSWCAAGYVVAVIDSFYFGERRMVVPPPPELQQEFLLVAEGSDHWIELLDQLIRHAGKHGGQIALLGRRHLAGHHGLG